MSHNVERYTGPYTGVDIELARECAMAAVRDYGTDDPILHNLILKNGIWNDHIAVQAALTMIKHIRKHGLPPCP